eukprot:TRINITY_DN3840_c0_g1_i2.p1 TRINITY_DN3840_c0_g1~~TRINITY_DN3840_c0_g1_i2.p1  ORF type:complete len:833 (+),score=94.94 TRINITY_DN3840_c0_g1_i2:57-2555(+)
MLVQYIGRHKPSLLAVLRVSKGMGDIQIMGLWYYLELIVGVICSGNSNSEMNDYCLKLIKKVKPLIHQYCGFIPYYDIPYLEAVVLFRHMHHHASSTYINTNRVLSKIQSARKFYKKLTLTNPSAWTARYLLVKGIQFHVKWLFRTKKPSILPRLLSAYRESIRLSENNQSYLGAGLASELFYPLMKTIDESEANRVKESMFNAYASWGCTLKLSLENKSLLNNLKIQKMLVELASLPRTSIGDLSIGILHELLNFFGLQRGFIFIDSDQQVFCAEMQFPGISPLFQRQVLEHIQGEDGSRFFDSIHSNRKGENPDLMKIFSRNAFAYSICTKLGDSNNILFLATDDPLFVGANDLQGFLKVTAEQVHLIIEAYECRKQLELQGYQRREAESLKALQATFIDALCHEIRNPVNGVLGSFYILQYIFQEESVLTFSEILRPKFVVFLAAAMLLSHVLPMKMTLVVAFLLLIYSLIGVSNHKRDMDESQKEFQSLLGNVKQCLDHQRDIIDNSLHVERLEGEATEEPVELLPVSLPCIIESVLSMFVTSIKKKSLILEYTHNIVDERCPEETNPKELLLINSLKFKQILVNLLSNAIKFTETGGIYVHSNVTKSDSHAVVEISVRDTGIGFHDVNRKLFNYFEQLQTNKRRDYEGTGLGLAISKKLVESMGGHISASSVVDEGTTFTFQFQALLSEKTPTVQPISPREVDYVRIKKLLVVDDNKLNRKTLTIFAKKKGVQTLEAGDGKEAISVFQSNPDIGYIVMDIKMPVMDGISATKEIRKTQPNKSKTVIIGLSGNPTSYQDAIDSGMNDFLVKPTPPFVVLQRLLEYDAS